MPLIIARLIDWVFALYSIAIIARVLLPWLGLTPYHPVMRFLIKITDPLLAPLRRRIRPVGAIDFTPMIALAFIWIARLIVLLIMDMIVTLLSLL